MNQIEKMAAIGFCEISATEKAAWQLALSILEMIEEQGGLEVFRSDVDRLIATGAETKGFKKWLKKPTL
ncbi:MAG: hypothetical protein WC829_15365 [Hyphomicrobium sp.]|jgi:hypothetical protein